jgi:RecG-like helicase
MKFNKITFSHPDVIETEAPEEEIENSEFRIQNDEEDSLEPKIQNSKLPTETYNTGRIFPIYSELNGISPGRFAQKMRSVLDKVDTVFHEYLPQELIKKF